MKLVLTFFFFGILSITSAQRIKCETQCKFRFCTNFLRTRQVMANEENPATSLGIPYAPMAGDPCFMQLQGRNAGKFRILSSLTGGEAQVSKEYSLDPFVPISQYRTDVVQPPIPSNFFRWVDNGGNGRQTIGRIAPMGNQDEVLDNVCVRIPITSYAAMTHNRTIYRVAPEEPTNCVAFRTRAVQLLVSFEWSTSNDFDLHLVEPNGFEINRFGELKSRTSPNGGHLVEDAAGELCEVESGKEVIRYPVQDRIVEPGTYTIRVDHTRLCSFTSPFRLRVYFKGDVILDESGDLMKMGQDVLVRTFTIPAMDNGVEDPASDLEAVMASQDPDM